MKIICIIIEKELRQNLSMAFFEQNQMVILFTLMVCTLCFQILLTLVTVFSLKSGTKESRELNKETFGLTKRIEGLTSEKREQMLKSFDKLLETLANRLPVLIAGQAGQQIFEMESKILQKLTELEPGLKENEENRSKLNELIRSMEGLETSLVSITSNAVQKIILEERKELAAQEYSH